MPSYSPALPITQPPPWKTTRIGKFVAADGR
jgi:hypothetical protein